VLAESIPVQSLCEHHVLPFHEIAHIGYLPGERILGLSKLARVVGLFARNLQVQERPTQQVADAPQEHLAPKGVGAVIEAEHQCMWLALIEGGTPVRAPGPGGARRSVAEIHRSGRR
jgi:GTP cyclohydrolase I